MFTVVDEGEEVEDSRPASEDGEEDDQSPRMKLLRGLGIPQAD